MCNKIILSADSITTMDHKTVCSYCTLRRQPYIFALKTETKLRKNKVTQFQPLWFKKTKTTHTHTQISSSEEQCSENEKFQMTPSRENNVLDVSN